MKGLKDFRRSLNKDRTSGGSRPGGSGGSGSSGGTSSNALSNVKGAISHQPPKMVLKAITDYKSRAPNELGFTKGDFFHVLTDPLPNAEWIEAFNPMTGARGLVPAGSVEIVTKSSRPGQAGAAAAGPSSSQSPAQRAAGAAMTAKGGGGLYAVVKYDFEAERDDELGAKAGESMIVIAQSNFECKSGQEGMGCKRANGPHADLLAPRSPLHRVRCQTNWSIGRSWPHPRSLR